MIWATVFLLAAAAEWGIKALFRWRTWRDRGLVAALVTAALIACMWTEAAGVVHDILRLFAQIPGGMVLLPALCALAGLIGMQPLVWAVFLGLARKDPALSWMITAPMIAGALPYTLFIACTMPPRGGHDTQDQDEAKARA